MIINSVSCNIFEFWYAYWIAKISHWPFDFLNFNLLHSIFFCASNVMIWNLLFCFCCNSGKVYPLLSTTIILKFVLSIHCLIDLIYVLILSCAFIWNRQQILRSTFTQQVNIIEILFVFNLLIFWYNCSNLVFNKFK